MNFNPNRLTPRAWCQRVLAVAVRGDVNLDMNSNAVKFQFCRQSDFSKFGALLRIVVGTLTGAAAELSF